MSRWICVDDICIPSDENDWEELVAFADAIAEQEPIKIVRCGECKHWERLNYEAPKEGWCDDQMPYSDGRWVDADDFCSYGEVSEKPTGSEKPNNLERSE